LKNRLSDNNYSLGDRIAAHFKKGDVVEWKGWKLLNDGSVLKEKYQGVLVELITETVGGRSVTYARVLPFQNDIVVEVNIFCLYKVKQKD
tara:strand:- start:216 stop:485 length:270 start_codon:yes stop_codon:yes gene_type:complete